MRIENLFEKDIFRPINGVVKADQKDDASVWQELDEFVITREMQQHLTRFFSQYSTDNAGDAEAAGRIGVWISGFFGSGKSHLIKVLSYLLENQEHAYENQRKRAIEFFEPKIHDAILLGDIQRAVASDTDVVLFNIESKADNRAGRDAILAVFLKVLNKQEGFCEDYPHIAHMERHLSGKPGKYQLFMDYYRDLTRTEWVDERDAYQFNRDQVVGALSKTLGQSRESAEKWVDGAEESFAVTVEKFAEWTKQYLDSRGPKHRMMFLVDEVGGFIGTDSHLMLSLQTLVEELGVVCQGRAWVVVTSQEDIDAVLGDIQGSRANDFSKIQGRFKTRLSLSSANIDEVLQERLLKKKPEVESELEQIWVGKGDIIRYQLTFKNVGMTFRQTRSAPDFAKDYPFAPYQFQLLQKIFEAIRRAGATGLHLSRGERSLLDGFQSAAKAVSGEEVGIAVPLYRFYPSIESFLDTSVAMTIKQAGDNASLESFDINVLQVLFLIRYVDEMKGNVDNLVTLCLDTIDADRLALRRKIEASLGRLEKETLISRSGEDYFFLSNEERDINREIKNVELGSGEEAKLLGEIIFSDVLRDQRKHRYAKNKMDFIFNRVCDLQPVGNRAEGALAVSVVTPLSDDYDSYTDARCILDSSQENGQVVIRLDDDPLLERDLKAWLRTDKYIRTKDDGTLAPATRRIHKDLADDNRIRREHLTQMLSAMTTGARWFAAGQRLQIQGTTPASALDEALEYLIENTFHKMKLLDRLLGDNAIKEIQAVLRSTDVAQQKLAMAMPESNPDAIADVRSYVELCDKASRQIVLHELLNGRYASRPYGWPQMETLLLLARLHAVGEIRFALNHAQIPDAKVYDAITTPSQWRKITVLRRRTADPQAIQKARQLGKDVFSKMGPDGEDPIFTFLRDKASYWKASLVQYKSLADTGSYPGSGEIDDGLALLKTILGADESGKFIERFNERRDELLELADRFRDLQNFYEHQRPTWERLRAAAERFKLNDMELQRDPDAADALRRIREIMRAPSPYGLIRETDGLIERVEKVNEALLARIIHGDCGTGRRRPACV
jgi:hypothetical protein